MSEFGKRELVLWYNTDHEFYAIRGEGDFITCSDYVAVSEPFDAEIIELSDGAERVNAAKMSVIDAKLDRARELIEFLNQQVRETRDARGEEIQREGLGAQMMEFASRDILENFLSRVETELLPSASWEPAERLLIDMLQLPQIQQNKQLLSRATNLLKLTVKARRKSQTHREDLLKEENGI